MGSRIAAHFANAGFAVDLLDIVPPEPRNAMLPRSQGWKRRRSRSL